MIPITHFALGLLMAVLFIIPLVDRYNDATIMVASGLWAMLPDVFHFIPVGDPAHGTLWANVFWLHPTLDAFETAHPHAEATVVLSMLAMAVVMVERKS